MDKCMRAAIEESKKSRCDRAHVGCVIVDRRTGKIVSRAFNETLSGNEPCDTGGHAMVDGHCKNTVHAELGALIKMVEAVDEYPGECVLYTTHYPCPGCAAAINFSTPIIEVVYLHDYNNSQLAADLLQDLPKGVRRVETETGA